MTDLKILIRIHRPLAESSPNLFLANSDSKVAFVSTFIQSKTPRGGDRRPTFILGDFVEAFVGGRRHFEEVVIETAILFGVRTAGFRLVLGWFSAGYRRVLGGFSEFSEGSRWLTD